jgi:DNA-binding NarL/FixJ family response regulator
MQRRPYLLIADDTLAAQCLQRLLESEFPGVQIIADGHGLVEAVAAASPDMILLDIKMTGLEGLEAIRGLAVAAPATKVVVVTMHDEPEDVAEAFRAGASGYVLKRCAVSELVTAIRRVLDGRSYTPQPNGQRVAKIVTKRKGRANGRGLTLRQREVLQLVAHGRTAKEVANALGLSVKTAVFHKMAIMDKLGLRTTADLTRYALQHGMLSPTAQGEASSSSAVIPLALTSTTA